MSANRLALSCMVVLLAGGCTQRVRTYDSQASVRDPASGRVVRRSSQIRQARRDGDLVDPMAVLDRSIRERMAWKALRPIDVNVAPIIARAGGDPAATASLGSRAGAVAPVEFYRDYDRNSAMEGLFASGRRAARPICRGC